MSSILSYSELEKLPKNELLKVKDSLEYSTGVDILIEDTQEQHYKVEFNSSSSNPMERAFTKRKLEEIIRQGETDLRTLRQVKKGQYQLSDVLKHPWKASSKGVLKEFRENPHIIGRGIVTRRDALLEDLLTLISFGITSTPHELMHAGMNTLTGGTNKEIVINRLYGGDLAAKLIPGVKSDWLFPLLGGYVKPEHVSELGKIATLATPYLLTPLGFYCIMKGAEKKSLPLTFLGTGALAGHLGGTVGDFFTLGRALVIDGINYISPESTYENSPWLYAPVIAGGFYIGLKAMCFTYRLSKGLINSVLDYSHNVATGKKPSLLERAKTSLESYLKK